MADKLIETREDYWEQKLVRVIANLVDEVEKGTDHLCP
jgi:hypothetical protein